MVVLRYDSVDPDEHRSQAAHVRPVKVELMEMVYVGGGGWGGQSARGQTDIRTLPT